MYRLGTRGSGLALAQAELVAARLRALGEEVALVRIRTEGDRNQHESSTALGIGVFVKEIEHALLRGEVDLAVHSAKDLPTAETAGLVIAAYLSREDPRDALVSRSGAALRDLPHGARVGTDSPRRRAFLLHARPDLAVVPIRGNVDTRLRKLEAGEYDAIVLAVAGLRRLGLGHTEVLDPEVMLPAAAQGAIAVQAREASPLLARLDHLPTRREIVAERAFLARVGGGCRAPVAALARVDGDRSAVDGAAISADGADVVRDTLAGPAADAAGRGAALAERVLARGAARLRAESRA